ncbi:acetyl-CoA acetyltransferase [Sulfitobacter litoralis]|uniref:acetyl-CoA acetyltransferase n=1 Tax=Sulfitobacter litoralis TaxID=335975 RepID=UPI002B276459|nr:acetyl-CoA acetyltransferase [Sulfitobacter litoralis]
MAHEPHPFLAVAEMAPKKGLKDLKVKVERGGTYVRLYQNDPPLFFKHRNDPSDSFDRENFNDFKRVLLSEEDCDAGPKATIELIRSLLEKFADYTPQRS